MKLTYTINNQKIKSNTHRHYGAQVIQNYGIRTPIANPHIIQSHKPYIPHFAFNQLADHNNIAGIYSQYVSPIKQQLLQ